MLFHFPTKIQISNGIINKLGIISKGFGDKALLVTGKNFLNETGILKTTLDTLSCNGIEVTHYPHVHTNPTDEIIDSAINLANDKKCNMVIGFGGGSAIDTAKMVSICIGTSNNSWDFFNDPIRAGKPIGGRSVPLIAIPTTSGSASEATPFAVVKNKKQNIKKGIKSNFLYPDISLIDPEILIHMPKNLTAWTGCDALGQSLESYTSGISNSLSDMFALQSLKLLIKYLPKAYRDSKNLSYRKNVAVGTTLSGMAISYTETNLAHAMAEALGGEYDLHHGLTVGLFSPAAMQFNMERSNKVNNKYRQIVSLINSQYKVNIPKEQSFMASEYSNTLKDFLTNLGIPKKTRELDLSEFDTNKLATIAINMGSIKSNIVQVQIKDLVDLFKRTW